MRHAALLPIAFAACAAAPAPVGVALTHIREQVTVGPLKVMPLAVVEDSRCPTDGMCIWAGRVVLRVAVDGPGVRRTLTLEGRKPYPVAGGTLALTTVEPVKARGKRMAPSAYRFGFTYKRGD